ncbi:MAG: nuclear transport factor 2 family protein [Planctomycetota bacterium]|nr:nuclear transport factor 2 family protein [Planctomycetota bacterium]
MTDLLFDPPWYLPAAIAALGIYLFIHGNRRQDAKVRAVGVGVALLTVALFFVGRVMETDREIAEKRSRQVVAAVEKHDWDALRALLDPKASVAVPNGAVYSNRDLIVGGAQMGTERFGLKNIRVLSLTSRQDDTMITVDIDALSDQGMTGQPFPTSWQFEWQELSGGWTLMRIVCLKIGQETGEGLRRSFPQP